MRPTESPWLPTGARRGQKRSRIGLILVIVGVAACMAAPVWGEEGMEGMPSEAMATVEVLPARAFFRPGEPVEIELRVTGPGGDLVAQVWHLRDLVFRQVIPVEAGSRLERLSLPPQENGAGFGVEVTLRDRSGQELARGSSAFDVAERWPQIPRYGFLSDFAPEDAARNPIPWMSRFHLTGIQFYDWMYRHDTYLPPEPLFQDPLGRSLSLHVVQERIRAARARGMAAMAYAAVYAASPAFAAEHPEWALLDRGGAPLTFGGDFLRIMNPEAGSLWHRHLVGEFVEVVRDGGFDGIHIDQYGDPKIGYVREGNDLRPVNIARAFADTVASTKAALGADQPVTFNAVNAWPLPELASSPVDFVYIEVWPPHNLYADLQRLIVEGKRLSGGKPVVLAAYLSPATPAAPLLENAVIFGSGGYHIQLGEQGLLADPYFPKYEPVGPELDEALRRQYDFAVRYRELLADGGLPSGVGPEWSFQGAPVTGAAWNANRVWAFTARTRVGEGEVQILNLINLVGEPAYWKVPKPGFPEPQGPIEVTWTASDPVASVWYATPDEPELAPRPLPFVEEGGSIRFTIPQLSLWDMVVVELASGR